MKKNNNALSLSVNTQTNQSKRFTRRACLGLIGGGIALTTLLAGLRYARTSICINTQQTSKKDIQSMLLPENIVYHWLTLAARAPSSHNMQPWSINLALDKNQIALYANPTCFLPAVDPTQRQSIISLGAFLESLSIAIQSDGYLCKIELFPEGEDLASPIAYIYFLPATKSVSPDKLIDFVNIRYNSRSEFVANRPVSQNNLDRLLQEASCHGIIANGTAEPSLVSRISQRAIAAWQIELTCEDVMLETFSVTRIGRCNIESYNDGIAVEGLLPELAAAAGLFPLDRIPVADSMAMRKMRDIGTAQANSASGWIWLSSAGNSRPQHIAAGRAFVRLHLLATQLGIALHSMSQAHQDYPAMAIQCQELHKDVGLDLQQHRIQMLARIGYTQDKDLTVRRPVNDFIRTIV